jgi:hypothetical protein
MLEALELSREMCGRRGCWEWKELGASAKRAKVQSFFWQRKVSELGAQHCLITSNFFSSLISILRISAKI